MTGAQSELVVIGYSISNVIASQTDKRYYTEPTGISERVDRVVVESLRKIVERVIQEVEECAQGRDWTAELTLDIGIGPAPVHLVGKLAITIKSTGA